MIIHSTTLDTEAKVKAIYGGESWSKIEGMFLLGQSSSYAINSTGGAATVALEEGNLPSHKHSIPALSGTAASEGGHTHTAYASSTGESSGKYLIGGSPNYSIHLPSTGIIGGAHTHSVTTTASNTGNTGSGTAHNNMPPYKTVYIWERTA